MPSIDASAGPDAIRVLLVDDHPVVREGLASLLQAAPDIEVVGQASTAAEALHKARELKPAVVLLDIRLPDANGPEVCRSLCRQRDGARVIMLTSFEDEDYLFKALRAGAQGYLLKTASHDEILEAMRAAVAGNRLLSAPQVDKLMAQFSELARRQELYDP